MVEQRDDVREHCLPLLSEVPAPAERGGNRFEQAFLLAGEAACEPKHLGETTGRLCYLLARLHEALEALLPLLRRQESEPILDDLHGRVKELIRWPLLEPLEELRVG